MAKATVKFESILYSAPRSRANPLLSEKAMLAKSSSSVKPSRYGVSPSSILSIFIRPADRIIIFS